MREMKDALLRLIDAALTAKDLDEKMNMMGYGKTPYADIYGKIEEALFIISGEDQNQFEGSMTQTVLSNEFLCLERRATILEYTRRSNEKSGERHVRQPAPHTIEREEFDRMYTENGGYMHGEMSK